MKRLFYLFTGASCLMLGLFVMQSCVDDDYDWDDVNKEAEFNQPPVPFGAFDSIMLGDMVPLPDIPPIEGLPAIEFEEAYDYVFSDLFNKDFIDYFFYEGNDVMLTGVADVSILKPNSTATLWLGLSFKVLDDNGKEIPEIVIPNQIGYNNTKGQPIEIKIASKYMKFFKSKNAKHLKVYLILKSSNVIDVDKDAYVEFKDIIFKSGALHFDF